MSDDSTTQCLLFPGIFRKPVVAQFDQREGSSDGGAVLLKAADRHYGLVEELSACLRDQRQAGKVDHTLQELVAQRVFSIACGYPDGNDSARLASDPIHKLLLDRDPVEGRDLASQQNVARSAGAEAASNHSSAVRSAGSVPDSKCAAVSAPLSARLASTPLGAASGGQTITHDKLSCVR